MVFSLRIIVVALWVACVAGAALVAGLVMGEVNSGTFLWSGVIGLVVGVPAGLLNWAWLRPNRARTIGWLRATLDRWGIRRRPKGR